MTRTKCAGVGGRTGADALNGVILVARACSSLSGALWCQVWSTLCLTTLLRPRPLIACAPLLCAPAGGGGGEAVQGAAQHGVQGGYRGGGSGPEQRGPQCRNRRLPHRQPGRVTLVAGAGWRPGKRALCVCCFPLPGWTGSNLSCLIISKDWKRHLGCTLQSTAQFATPAISQES